MMQKGHLQQLKQTQEFRYVAVALQDDEGLILQPIIEYADKLLCLAL